MSTDRLQALSGTIAGILNEPPSRVTYFDAEPHDEEAVSESAAKAFGAPVHGADAPKGSFGKLSSREAGISRDRAQVENAGGVSNQIDEPPGAGQRSKLEAASLRSDPQTLGVNVTRSAISGQRMSLRRWGVFGLAGILLSAGLGVAAVGRLGPSGEVTKANSQGLPAAAAELATLPSELTPLLQSVSRELAGLRGDVEQLKRGREQMNRDSASFSEQFKASQEQLGRALTRLSDQMKATQEAAERSNANAVEQIRVVREQLSRLEQNAAPKKLAPSPRITASPAPKPAPATSSPQAAAQPAAAKPKPAPTTVAPASASVR